MTRAGEKLYADEAIKNALRQRRPRFPLFYLALILVVVIIVKVVE